MELAAIFAALKRRRFVVAVVVAVAIFAAVGVKLSMHSAPTGQATVQILVDSPQSAIADLEQNPLPLATRASVFAQVMTSRAVLESIAHSAGVPVSQITAEGPYSGPGQALDVPTPSEARGAQLLASTAAYRMTFVAQMDLPIVTASVQGPTPQAAGRLAASVYPGLQAWLSTLPSTQAVPASRRVTIRELGDAQAGEVNSSSATTLAGIAAVGILIVGLLAVIALDAASRRRQRGGDIEGMFADRLPHGLSPPQSSRPSAPSSSWLDDQPAAADVRALAD